jgi:hypothetical protein
MMAAGERHRQLTEEDISEFGRQLYEWSKKLPIAQQGLLHRILSRAAAASDGDTAGYLLADPQPLDRSAIDQLLRDALLPGTELRPR